MHVAAEGIATTGQPLRRAWYLIARQGHGPQIPCIPAIVIARKLARGEPIAAGARAGGGLAPGARPCVGMMTLEEFEAEAAGFDIRWEIREEATTLG
jgi:hypothetical protein